MVLVVTNTGEHSCFIAHDTERDGEIDWWPNGEVTESDFTGPYGQLREFSTLAEAEAFMAEWSRCASDDDPGVYCHTHNRFPRETQ